MNDEKSKNQKLIKTSVPNLWKSEQSGIYYLNGRFGGKLKRQSLKTTTFSDAKLLLADRVKEERQAVKKRQPDFKSGLTFEQAFESLVQQLKAQGKKATTLDYYDERVKAIYQQWPEIRTMPCSKITSNACENWSIRYQEHVENTTYNGTLMVLRRVFNRAVKHGVVTRNPVEELRRLKIRPKKPIIPTKSQFEKMISHLELSPYYKIKEATKLIKLLAMTGMRIGEANRLKWSDVDFGSGKLYVMGDPETGTKNWQIREIPLFEDLEKFLRKEKAERPEEKADQKSR